MKSFSEIIRAAVKKSGLTHYRIAKDAGVAPAILDRFVTGQRDITLGTASKVAQVLGLSLVQDGKNKS